MKFELNEYHRNVPDEKLILDVKNTAEELGKTTLTRDEYTTNGKYHSDTLTRRFGSWKKVLELSDLDTEGHNFKKCISEEDVIAELHRIANITGRDTVTIIEFENYSRLCSVAALNARFGSWSKILKLAGMKNKNLKISDEELYEEIERIWILLGRQPTYTDMRNGISKYSPRTFEKHFGTWRGTLESFIKYVNGDDEHLPLPNSDNDNKDCIQKNEQHQRKHITNRNINLRLRFLVMKRDNFKCRICGASPAKDPAIELHIDHIIPWSKGGETTIDNLQTLCSKCNLGKSDLG